MPPGHSQTPIALLPAPGRRATTDADLARGLVAGDPWALSEAWRRFAPMVLTAAARALGSQSEAEDVAQEVFQRVFRKAATLREPGALRSFIFSFAVRVLKTELRSRKARGWLSFHRPDTLPDVADVATDLESRDLLRRFYALLDRLSARDRLVFAFRHMERMTIEEVAASLGLSVSTVKRSLAHATEKLACWVEGDAEMTRLLRGDPEP